MPKHGKYKYSRNGRLEKGGNNLDVYKKLGIVELLDDGNPHDWDS